MARPREFEEADALEKAMNVFWQNGYEGASLTQLLDGMGLTRGSLYKAFVDKKSLFLKVLALYDQMAVSEGIDLLTDKSIPNGWVRILALFDSIVDAVNCNDQRGCLLCSTAAEPTAYDTEITTAVNASIKAMRDAFQVAIDDTPSDIRTPINSGEGVADFLVAQYVGLRILSRSELHKDSIKQSVTALRRFNTSQVV